MRKLFRQVGDFNTRVQESVGGIRVVKAFANEDYERQLFAANNEGYKTTKLNAYAYMTASITMSAVQAAAAKAPMSRMLGFVAVVLVLHAVLADRLVRRSAPVTASAGDPQPSALAGAGRGL